MPPLSWEQLCAFRERPPSMKLQRDPVTQAKYESYKVQHPNPESIFKGLHQRLESVRGRFDSLFPQTPNVVIAYNNFPYWCDEGIRHLVVWMMTEDDIHPLKHTLEELLGADDMVFFRNHDWNKSISEIPHTHLFVRGDNTIAVLNPIQL